MRATPFKKTLSCIVASLFCFQTQTFADDTEIFVGKASSSTGVKPNILFVLDNSGSMDGASYDENGKPSKLSRIENMKVAFEDVMNNASGLNVGLMTFNGSGGSIIYPVKNIDTELTSQAEAADSSIGMTSGADDAIELKSSGNVYVDDETLTIAHRPDPESVQTVTAFIQNETDNAEETISSGYMQVNQREFNMNNDQVNGLRFKDLGIPKNAKIVSATLEFTSYRYRDSHIYQRIYAQNADNPGTFEWTSYNISNRLSDKTTEYVDWELYGTTPWNYGEKYSSPNLAAVVQEVVEQPFWDPNDALVFLFTPENNAAGYRDGTLRKENNSSTQGLNGSGTLLHITYTASETDQIVGLRFDNVNIPAGATVTSARIDFVSAAANVSADDLKIQVKIENTADAAAFSSSKNNLSSRTKHSDVVTWHPDDAWEYNQTVTGPNVTSLVQRVVSSTSGWCGGNAMAFYLEPSTSSDVLSRLAYAYEAGIGKKPTLTVNYTGGEGGCIERSSSHRISSGENDAFQYGSKGWTYNDTSTINLNAYNYLGLRFEGLPIEPGKEVLEAYLEFTAADDDTGSTVMTIEAEDSASPAAFPQSRRNITNRDMVSGNVQWNLENWEDDVTYRSPDISSIVNKVLNRSDWQSGNAIAFQITMSNYNDRDIWSYDGDTGKAPRLIIKAESGGIAASTNTVRYHEIDLVNDLDPRGMTPLTGSLYEAAMYYTGGPVTYGVDRDNSRYGRVSHSESWTGGSVVRSSACSDDDLDDQKCASEYISGSPVYTSPITSACQTSHVVILTDGAANQNEAEADIASLTGISNCTSDATNGGEKCARTLAKWMANNDLRSDLSGNANTVKTHTIAFNLSSPVAVDFLTDLAAEGDGGFYSVNTAQELTTAFDTIIQSVRSTAATFVAPGATVNQFNRLSHRNEVYFSVFKPDSAPRWAGNLKRYKLLGSPAVISDINDKAAVDSGTGYFKETAQSVWSTNVDGAYVSKGGAASQRPVTPDSLRMYTWLGGSKDLTASVNKLHESNSSITQTMLGVDSSSSRSQLLQWIRGVDVKDWDSDSVTNEVRAQYEDPLHSVPHIITYGGTDENPDTVIYFGTNGGYLHAVNGATGEEVFSFVPQSQLSLMQTRFDNTETFTHPYGVDGSPTSWTSDKNGDNQISSQAGDFAYLYFGMRRGGQDYYALDVSDRNAPKVLWTIEGGSGDFAQLGQSWSTPVKARISLNGTVKDVIIFGGGYNTKFDDASYASSTSTGNAVYIVDAKTGERLWYASSDATTGNGLKLSAMHYPIPADVAVIDIDGDGLVDQMYASDVFGQLFRFDVNKTTSSTGNWFYGGVIAQLGSSSTPNNRRFFNSPDVSLTSIAKKQKIAIAIGSGSRPNPLSKVTQDRFFMILQDTVFNAPQTYTTIHQTDLVDQTTSITNLTDADSGWYFDLPNSGEKVLSTSITVAGKIIMTTYSPDSVATSCNPVVGTGRSYVFNLANASAFADLDEDGSLEDTQDRSKTLASGNIPPSPKVLFPEEGAPVVLVGPEQPLGDIDLGLVDEWTQIYRRPEDPE